MRVFNIDITRKGISPVVQVTEYDAMSRFFTLVLRNGSSDYEPPENPTYSVWYKTKDSTGWYDTITLPDESTRPAVVADGNAFTIEIAEQATTSCGELALMINGDDGYQLTISGIITRSDDIPGYDGEEVENYYNVYIADMRKNAARAENAAQTAIEYGATIDVEDETLIIDHYDDAGEVETWATVSEAWAVGKRNGVDVPSTDETYHNNAKYYAESAAGTVEEAEAAAEAAAASAEEAAASATSVESMRIVTEASGSVAAFPDGANDVAVKSLVAEITPVQSGTGDPSPTNIRPVSGRTGMTVTRAGKNLIQNIKYKYNENIVYLGANTNNYELYLPAGTYTFSVEYLNNTHSGAYYRFVSDSANRTAWSPSSASTTGTITVDKDENFNLWLYQAGGFSASNIGKFQIEAGSTATTYAPYAGHTYPVSWQTEAGTVYGGTLDVVSGVLTVDRAIVEMDGSSDETWVALSTSNVFRHNALVPAALVARRTDAITNETNVVTYNYDTMKNNYPSISFDTNGRLFLAIGDSYTTVAQCREWLAANPLQVCYYVATPQVIQLSPTEIRSLLGGNTIYTDAGAVSVTYVADTKKYIDNKIAELQALVLEN